MGLTEFECEQCGLTFSRLLSRAEQKKHHFCSKKCYGIWAHATGQLIYPNKVEIICEQCGVSFQVKKSREQTVRYCSILCYSEGKKKQYNQKNSVVCENCGTIFKKKYNNYKTRFCSVKCMGLWRSKTQVKESNDNWRGGKDKRVCKECGVVFYVYLTIRAGTFCSTDCKNKWQRKEEYLRAWYKKRRSYNTSIELFFKSICAKYNLPFKFVGDGNFWVGNMNPDFIESNGKKIAVEIFGDYWHSPLLNKNVCYSSTAIGRKENFKNFGWSLIILWESDLKRKDAEKFILTTITSFYSKRGKPRTKGKVDVCQKTLYGT